MQRLAEPYQNVERGGGMTRELGRNPEPQSSPLSDFLCLGEGDLTGLVKENFDIAGLPTKMGSAAFSGSAPALSHAEAVERLIAGGVRITARTKMHELAFGVTGINDWQGTPVNPRFPDRIPGGSSSGSAAAVAAGVADFALGTDTGGSIRVPAACCGVVGLKPTFGRISRRGVTPIQSSLDCVGIFAKRVAVIQRVMALLDPAFNEQTAAAPHKIGVVIAETDNEIATCFDAAMQRIGASVQQVELNGFDDANRAGMKIIAAEMRQEFAHRRQIMAALGEDVRSRIEAAALITQDTLDAAEQTRQNFACRVDQAFDRVDILALPTLATVPPTLAEAHGNYDPLRLTALVRPFNLSGHPAISLPIMTADGLPAGLQLIARRGDDARLCAIARYIETRLSDIEGTAL